MLTIAQINQANMQTIAERMVRDGLDWQEYGSEDRILWAERDECGNTEVWVIEADTDRKIYRVI